jgi:acyl carrier protein
MKINKKNKKKILKNFLINFFNLEKNYKKKIEFETIDRWDSISHLDLIISLEKKFKLKLKKNINELTSEDKILKKL